MKKQINPTVKAHLIRGAFYVLLLLAVCVIPFALAQRNTTRRAVTKPKVAANARNTNSAASQARNDVVSAPKTSKPSAKSSKAKTASTRFSNALGRVPQSAALHKRPTGPSGVVCSYEFATGGDAIVPGDTDIGLHTDDGDTFVALPFTFQLYDQTFSGVNVSSNGRLDFVCVNEPGGFSSACLPPPDNLCAFDYTIFPLWSDYNLGVVGEGCANFASGCGVFTSVSGSAPNRIFNIEWRGVYFADHNQTANFEARLYEGDPNLRFDFVFGTVNPGSDQLYVSGVEQNGSNFTEDFCDAGPPAAGSRTYTCTGVVPTPTPTPTGTPGGGCTVNGSIDGSDPTQTDRMFRDGIPSTCAVPKVCPGPFGDGLQHHYDSYTYTNNTGSTQCVTVDPTTECVGTNYTFVVAYLGSFNPADICENYLADSGSSPDPTQPPVTFSFNVDPGQSFVVVVSEVTADAGCNAYTLNITPEEICGGGGPCTLGPWNIVADYPLTSESVSCSSDGTFLYAVGGFDGINFVPTDSFNQFDLANNVWTPLPNIPTGFYDAPSVYAANTNSIYVFGGFDPSFVVRDIVQIYNVGTGTWEPNGAPMPDPAGRYFAAAVYYPVDGRIYVFGGFDGVTFSEQTNAWAYDPVSNTWDTSLAPIPVGIGGAGYSIVGDFAYLQGHWNGGLGSTDNYQYDILNNSWTTKAPVPVNIYRPASGAIDTNAYLVGGGDPFIAPGRAKGPTVPKAPHPSAAAPATSFNSTYIYDTVGDSWSVGPNTNVAHSFTGGAAVGPHFVVVTGFDGGGDTSIVEQSDCGGGGGGTPTPTPTPSPGTPSPTPTPGSCPPVITQSTTQDIVSGNSVACNDGFGHTDNSYWRAFNMNEFTGGQDYNITSVDFGIELAQSGGGTGQPVRVRLYANHGSPFPLGDWQSNMIADSGDINIPDQSLTIFNLPLVVTAPGSALELVFELFTPNGQAVGNLFFVGSNPDPETGLSYLSAADCGVTVPTPTGDLGFPDMHIVFNVNGSCPAGSPTPTATATATATATTPPASATPTATATATGTPRVPPTPRPRPTPFPRPTP
jgi:hypothetical protein